MYSDSESDSATDVKISVDVSPYMYESTTWSHSHTNEEKVNNDSELHQTWSSLLVEAFVSGTVSQTLG